VSIFGPYRDHRDDGCVIHLARLGVILGAIFTVIAMMTS